MRNIIKNSLIAILYTTFAITIVLVNIFFLWLLYFITTE